MCYVIISTINFVSYTSNLFLLLRKLSENRIDIFKLSIAISVFILALHPCHVRFQHYTYTASMFKDSSYTAVFNFLFTQTSTHITRIQFFRAHTQTLSPKPRARQNWITWSTHPLPSVAAATAAQLLSLSHDYLTILTTANAPSVAAMGQHGVTTTPTKSKSKQSQMQLPSSTSGETVTSHSTSATLADACKSNNSCPI